MSQSLESSRHELFPLPERRKPLRNLWWQVAGLRKPSASTSRCSWRNSNRHRDPQGRRSRGSCRIGGCEPIPGQRGVPRHRRKDRCSVRCDDPLRPIELPGQGARSGVQDPFSFPHKLPMLVAMEAANHPSDVMIWCDPEEDIAGLFHSMGREPAWPASRLVIANAVILRPDAGSGAAGLELGLEDSGPEAPVRVSRPFRDDVAVLAGRQTIAFRRIPRD